MLGDAETEHGGLHARLGVGENEEKEKGKGKKKERKRRIKESKVLRLSM